MNIIDLKCRIRFAVIICRIAGGCMFPAADGAVEHLLEALASGTDRELKPAYFIGNRMISIEIPP
jgi:hypothetical protein